MIWLGFYCLISIIVSLAVILTLFDCDVTLKDLLVTVICSPFIFVVIALAVFSMFFDYLDGIIIIKREGK